MFWDATPFSIFSSQGLCRFSRVVPGRSTTWLPKYLRPASGRPDDRLRMSGDRNRRRSHLQKPEGYRMQHQKLVIMGRRFSGDDDLFCLQDDVRRDHSSFFGSLDIRSSRSCISFI